jgi:tetratricopeptide (TPR) repeat protein
MRKRPLRLGLTAGAAAAIAFMVGAHPEGTEARGPELERGSGSLLGSYLAGRIARGQNDTAAASEFFRRALERDPGNEALIEQSVMMLTTEGRVAEAIVLARRLLGSQPTHRMSKLLLGIESAKAGRWREAQDHFKIGASGVMGELTSVLARAWLLSAEGDIKGATALLDTIRQPEWTQFFIRYHKALLLDVAGQRSEARPIHERNFRGDQRSLRVALAYAQHASTAGDQKLARAVIDEYIKKNAANVHPVAKALAERLKDSERTGLLVKTPLDGISEVFYGLGEAMTNEGAMANIGAVYLQMALYLVPDSPFALAALASHYEAAKKYEAAIAAYDRVPKDSPMQPAIEIRKALNLNQLERVEEAKRILEAQMARDPTDLRPIDAIGTIMRGHKRFEEAIAYYNKAIAIIGPKPEKKHWTYFYARGTSYERIKKWPQAEADLLKALQLSPDEPLVLNYLGYSWVDQNKNLKQGLALIEKAVAKKPDDGYIVDSLGWAFYRLGNYKDAVRHLERAVELRPEDPVLNDHLGDAYWRVGRYDEARFQWRQALTLKPEPEEIEKINRKLAKGLPAKPQARAGKKPREASRTPDLPKKRTENKTGTQRPVLE